MERAYVLSKADLAYFVTIILISQLNVLHLTL